MAAPQQAVQAIPASAPMNLGAVRPGPALPASDHSARAPLAASTKLRYTGVAPIRIRGPQTGRTYVFSRSEPEAAVDRRDVEGLIRIGLFRRVA